VRIARRRALCQRARATLNLCVRLAFQAEVVKLRLSRELRLFGIQAPRPEPGRVSWDHAKDLSAVNQTNEAGVEWASVF
jgi:hypothetical protein